MLTEGKNPCTEEAPPPLTHTFLTWDHRAYVSSTRHGHSPLRWNPGPVSVGVRKAGPGRTSRHSRVNQENSPPEREARIEPTAFRSRGPGRAGLQEGSALRVRETATHHSTWACRAESALPCAGEHGVLSAAPASRSTRPAHTHLAPGPCQRPACVHRRAGMRMSGVALTGAARAASTPTPQPHPSCPRPGPRAERSHGALASGRAWLRRLSAHSQVCPDALHSHSRHCTQAAWETHT